MNHLTRVERFYSFLSVNLYHDSQENVLTLISINLIMNSFCEEEILLCKQIRLQCNFEILRKIVTCAFEQRKGLP